jgi:alpha-1,3-glucosyltransferase
MDPIRRIFPFSRGLFEDKVANFWCFSNVLVKWKHRASSGTLVKLSTALTALGFLPSVAGLLRSGTNLQVHDQNGRKEPKEGEKDSTLSNPGPLLPLLPWAMLTSSLSFFLFSFQVHEKTILVPLLPLTLIMANAVHDPVTWEWGMLGNNVGVFR